MDNFQEVVGPKKEPFSHYVRVLGGSLLAAVWARRLPPAPSAPRSPVPSDNLQRAMNLIMPLRHPLVVTRGEVAEMLAIATDEILVGLNNVGTVHFARFDIVAGNLCMFSVYDGEISGYIRDFIVVMGTAFDAIMEFVKDPPQTPVGFHVDEFLAWIDAHDAFQMPELATDASPQLATLQRDTLMLLHRHPNVMLGLYRAYPGYSAAQIRQSLAIGW